MAHFAFRPFEDSDLNQYEKLVRPLMEPEDYVSPDEYRELQKSIGLKFWIIYDGNKWAGWCSGADRSRTFSQFPHIYGLAVMPEYRGRGLSNRIYEHLIGIYGHRDMAVSIQPQKIQSLNIAIKHGFKPFQYKEPWIELVRKAT